VQKAADLTFQSGSDDVAQVESMMESATRTQEQQVQVGYFLLAAGN
jgi:hypothetical protein